MRVRTTAALVSVLAIALSACSSGDKDSKNVITLGALTSLSGSAAATFKDFPAAVQARIKAYEEADGLCRDRTFEVVEADDASSAEGALKSSQKLIQEDKVFAVLQASSFFYGASAFLTGDEARSTLVVGGGFDGAKQYAAVDNNLFGVLPPNDYKASYAAPGEYLAGKDVTKLALFSYGTTSAAKGLKQVETSAEAADISIAKLDDKVAIDAPDIDAIVEDIVDSRANGLYLTMAPETNLAIVDGLRDENYLSKLKLVLLTSGYGADLLASQPALDAAQDVTIATPGWAPVELGGASVETMVQTLQKYAGLKDPIPSYGATMGYLEADLFLAALDKAGCDATPAQLIETLRPLQTWDGGGLLPTPRDFQSASPAQVCSYYVTVTDAAFVPDPDGSPSCGAKLTASDSDADADSDSE